MTGLPADQWFELGPMKEGNVKEQYDWVAGELDNLLEQHGYRREGRYYRALRPNRDTLALFCHFGVECVLLSHLMSVSPMVLWQGLCALPTSVTTVLQRNGRRGLHVSGRLGSGICPICMRAASRLPLRPDSVNAMTRRERGTKKRNAMIFLFHRHRQ